MVGGREKTRTMAHPYTTMFMALREVWEMFADREENLMVAHHNPNVLEIVRDASEMFSVGEASN